MMTEVLLLLRRWRMGGTKKAEEVRVSELDWRMQKRVEVMMDRSMRAQKQPAQRMEVELVWQEWHLKRWARSTVTTTNCESVPR